jgi:histidine ammonia-lyase
MLISIFYVVVYGINTGFGSFASKIIPDDKLG